MIDRGECQTLVKRNLKSPHHYKCLSCNASTRGTHNPAHGKMFRSVTSLWFFSSRGQQLAPVLLQVAKAQSARTLVLGPARSPTSSPWGEAFPPCACPPSGAPLAPASAALGSLNFRPWQPSAVTEAGMPVIYLCKTF